MTNCSALPGVGDMYCAIICFDHSGIRELTLAIFERELVVPALPIIAKRYNQGRAASQYWVVNQQVLTVFQGYGINGGVRVGQ